MVLTASTANYYSFKDLNHDYKLMIVILTVLYTTTIYTAIFFVSSFFEKQLADVTWTTADTTLSTHATPFPHLGLKLCDGGEEGAVVSG